MVAADARTAITFALSPGEAHDAPEGRKLLRALGKAQWPIHLLMDRAYEGDETRQLALDLNFIPVVPPKSNRVNAWEYDRAMYKRRNQIERLFRRLKGFRRIFSRFEKLDVMFIGFINFTLIVNFCVHEWFFSPLRLQQARAVNECYRRKVVNQTLIVRDGGRGFDAEPVARFESFNCRSFFISLSSLDPPCAGSFWTPVCNSL